MTCTSLPSELRSAAKRLGRRIVAIVLTSVTTSAMTASAFADDLSRVNPTGIEAKVKNLGAGEHVEVRLKSGGVFRGSIAATPEVSFTSARTVAARIATFPMIRSWKLRRNERIPVSWRGS